jgi:hypothetical protein
MKERVEAAAGFEPAHNGFAVRSLNHLGTPPCLEVTHSYTTRAALASVREGSCATHVLDEAAGATPRPSRIAVAPLR